LTVGLQIVGLSKTFPVPGEPPVVALEGLDLAVAAGELVVLVGPNGSGKSTLLDIIAGKQAANSGSIVAHFPDGPRDWSRLNARDRSRHVVRIHQDPANGTDDDLTVAEHLRLAALRACPIPFMPAIPRAVLARIGDGLAHSVLATKLNSLVAELSGGQRQLLALEMAAARRARILLLDEPTASLDAHNAAFCFQRIEELRRQIGATVIIVTHDLAAAAAVGDRLLVLRKGRISADLRGREKASLRAGDIFGLCAEQEEPPRPELAVG
jgi:putative ABC transport system ATP-binding protein